MAEIVYLMCAITSIVCATMLFKGYRAGKPKLLLWSSLCFSFLALNNVMLFVDLALLPEWDFMGLLWRNLLGALAGGVLLFGLAWELT